MMKDIKLPPPTLQIDFAFALKRLRSIYLQQALLETVRKINIPDLDRQLAEFVSSPDLASMAKHGLRGELLFPVPLILENNPYLLGYYRLLIGYSQKKFYSKHDDFNLSIFHSMEKNGKISTAATAAIPLLCKAICESASLLLEGIGPLQVSKELLDDLTLLTIGPQLRGGENNKLGTEGTFQVFEIIREIVSHTVVEVRENAIEVLNAAKRRVLIEFLSDPDITIKVEMAEQRYRNIIAIEIKSGTDISNIHNRIGEAEKSHQKARKNGFTECWTVVNVMKLDIKKAHSESPSTDIFYSLIELSNRTGKEYEDFRERVISLTGIPTPPSV